MTEGRGKTHAFLWTHWACPRLNVLLTVPRPREEQGLVSCEANRQTHGMDSLIRSSLFNCGRIVLSQEAVQCMRGDKELAKADHLGPCLRDITELAEVENNRILTARWYPSVTQILSFWGEEGGTQRGWMTYLKLLRWLGVWTRSPVCTALPSITLRIRGPDQGLSKRLFPYL